MCDSICVECPEQAHRQTGSELVVLRVWGINADGAGASLGGGKNVLELEVMVVQLCKHSRNTEL